MMISPKCFAMKYKDESYEELITVRNELMEEIRTYEEHRIPEEEYYIDPSPDVQYWCNLKYMIEVCKLIDEAYNDAEDEDEDEEEDDEI